MLTGRIGFTRETNKLHDGIMRLEFVYELKRGRVGAAGLLARIFQEAELDRVAHTGLGRATATGYGQQAVVEQLDAVGWKVEPAQHLTVHHCL